VGILDQTTSGFPFVSPYEKSKIEYDNDDDFARKIESVMPKDAMIFQLPYLSFPDTPNIHRLTIFDPLRMYLHSRGLRWSYGAMKSRKGDVWQRWVTTKPLNKMVETLAFTGFRGIYLDRFAYVDEGKELEGKLLQLLQVKPIISNNQRLVFFDMTPFVKKLKKKYTENDFKIKQSRALDLPLPLNSLWKNGFSVLERKPHLDWRWCSSKGELYLINPWHEQRKIVLQMTVATGYEDFSDLLITSPLFSEELKINSLGKSISRTLMVPPGKHLVEFESNAKRVEAPNDSRILVFRVMNFRIKEVL
jgi:phosphoglycerol transferase